MLFLLVAAMLAGCGGSGNAVDTVAASESEELLDPVVGIPAYDVAAYRTLYDAEVYSALVCPLVEEYRYETKQTFGSYGKIPGEAVEAGDVLLGGTTQEIDEKIEELQEAIDEEERDYGISLADLHQDLTEAKEKEAQTGTDYISVLSNGPEEDSPYYDGFARGVLPLEGVYKKAALARRKIEEQISELEKTHALTKAHNEMMLSFSSNIGNFIIINSYSFWDILRLFGFTVLPFLCHRILVFNSRINRASKIRFIIPVILSLISLILAHNGYTICQSISSLVEIYTICYVFIFTLV